MLSLAQAGVAAALWCLESRQISLLTLLAVLTLYIALNTWPASTPEEPEYDAPFGAAHEAAGAQRLFVQAVPPGCTGEPARVLACCTYYEVRFQGRVCPHALSVKLAQHNEIAIASASWCRSRSGGLFCGPACRRHRWVQSVQVLYMTSSLSDMHHVHMLHQRAGHFCWMDATHEYA